MPNRTGNHKKAVILVESRLVDSGHRIAASTHSTLQEIGVYLVTYVQLKLVGNDTGYQNVARCHTVRKRWHHPLFQILGIERKVVVLSHPLEQIPHKIIISTENTGFSSIALYMFYGGYRGKVSQQSAVSSNRQRFMALSALIVADVNMRAKAYSLLPHLVLESKRHRYGHKHHRQAQGHTSLSYEHSRTRHAATSLLTLVESPGDE